MAVSVKKIALWRGKIEDRPGTLAEVLEPIAAGKGDLQVVMGYREPGATQSVVELYPVAGKKVAAALMGKGLGPAGIPSLLVTGDNRPGMGHAMARALGEAGINMSFLVAQTAGRKFSAVFGFGSEADADRAGKLIKKAASARR
ncbi:MAG TPA: hypothetical protein VLI67_00360 [Vicinamibacteria bacterium]|nr:hypothetical protein [Vicinamibacteria bacterium]